MDHSVVEYMRNAAESYRAKLPSGGALPPQTYKDGFDVGYALGHAHAFEEVLKRLGVAPQETAEESQANAQQANGAGASPHC